MSAVKIYPGLVKAITGGLKAYRKDGKPVDHYLRELGRNRQLGSRDRRFVGKQLYDIIRYQRWFDHMNEAVADLGLDKTLCAILLNHLREEIDILNIDQLLPADQWQKLKLAHDDTTVSDVIRTSYPDWIWERGEVDYGDQWLSIAEALNQTPPVYIRTNLLKTDTAKLIKSLTKDGFELSPTELQDCTSVANGKQLNQHSLYRQGHFEFQDMASQQVAHAVALDNATLLIDVCAGAGGKSLHLASLMKNKGHILAADEQVKRLEQLKYRQSRAGARNIEVVGMISLLDFKEEADLVLLDVPCSATGTIGRKPAAKWLFTEEDLTKTIVIQENLIREYAGLVKPDGALIYATCSVLKAESEAVVANFLTEHPVFELEREMRFIPGESKTDGFYFAVLRNTSH